MVINHMHAMLKITHVETKTVWVPMVTNVSNLKGIKKIWVPREVITISTVQNHMCHHIPYSD